MITVPKITSALIRDEFGSDVIPAEGWVAGRVTGHRQGNSTYGTFERFIGDFRLFVREGGKGPMKMFRSTRAIFPGVLEDEILMQLADAGADGGPVSVEFGARIWVDNHPTKPRNVMWFAEPTTPPSGDQERRFLDLLGPTVKAALQLPEKSKATK